MASTFEAFLLSQNAFLTNVPMAQLVQVTTGTALTTNAWGSIGFDSSTIDNYNGHSNSTNNSRYTIQVAGKYQVAGVVAHGTSSTGDRGAKVIKNGAVIQGAYSLVGSASTTHGVSVPVAPFVVQCIVGDYLELQGYQNSGGSLTTTIGTDQACSFLIRWVGY